MTSQGRWRWICVVATAVLFSAGACGDGKKKTTKTAKDEQAKAAAGGQADPQAGGGTTAPKGPVDTRTGDVLPVASGPAPMGEVRSAVSEIRSGQYEAAIRSCRKALRKNEKYTPAMVLMARAYFHLGKTEFAESMCTETALKINPNSGGCYNLLGHIALKQENRELALKNFEKATQVSDKFGPGWLNYGALLIQIKNYQRAVSVLERAVQLLPNRPAVHLNLGAAYRGAGQLVKARSSLLKALSMKARYPAAYFNLGLLYLDAIKVFDGKTRLQQLTEAVAYFNRYKQTGSYKKDDPVDEYIKQAHTLHTKEKRRIEREKRKQARDAARKAAAAKPAPAKPAPKK